MLVNAAGMIIQEVLGLGVTTERERVEIKRIATLPHSKRLLLSDLWVADGGRPKAVEVERSQKSQKSYQEIWEAYERHLWRRFPDSAVLYLIVDMPGVKKRFLKYARDWGMQFIYFAAIEDFYSSAGKCRFVGYRKSFELLRAPEKTAQFPQR